MIIQLASRIVASEALSKKIYLPVMPEPGGPGGSLDFLIFGKSVNEGQ